MKINNNLISGDKVAIEFNGATTMVEYGEFMKVIRVLLDPKKEQKEALVALRKNSFEKFWTMYGKKNKKESAWKKWLKLKDHEIQKIFETLPAFLALTKDIQFRPFPDTYLNQKRWEDEIQPSQPKSQLPSFAQPATFGR